MKESASGTQLYRRFSVLHRLLHIVTMMGFIGLAFTGLSLAFSSQWWAKGVAWVLGGAENTGDLHRFLAVMTYACVVVHILWFLYYRMILKGTWSGPQSLLPRWQDLKDFFQHVRFFFGRRKTPPPFNKFSYFEKFDYWAFFLGMNTMGITGLFLWFPETVSRFLPGYFVNLAQVLHLYEAIMAVSLKFVIHTLTTHVRPGVYPLDKTIFTGLMTRERIMAEHPGQWEQLAAATDVESASGHGPVS